MDNLEYLKKVKESEKEYLKVLIRNDITRHNDTNDEYRKLKVLEIIAEQIINLDNTLACIVSTLENIETAIKQGG